MSELFSIKLPRIPWYRRNWKFIIKHKLQKMRMSHNKHAKLLMGIRERGIPLYCPYELEYFCPICEKKPFEIPEWDDWDFPENLTFSEYNGFMYCHNCNLDIPSILCRDNSTKEQVKLNTEIYLDIAKMIKEGFDWRKQKPIKVENKNESDGKQ